MTSPAGGFRNSLFGQLKTLSDGVQGAFEQRITRPLIALKRDLARSSSKNRTEPDQDPTPATSNQQSSSSSSPLETSDLERSNPVKIIIDKIKHTVTSAAERRISQESAAGEQHASSDASPSTSRFSHHKSVSFAQHTQFAEDSLPTSELQNERARDTDCVSKDSICDNYEGDFDRRFRQMIKPRRISLGNSKELAYQDLSAEIVAYVLKHALRAIQQEDAEFVPSQNQPLADDSDQNDDTIDLK